MASYLDWHYWALSCFIWTEGNMIIYTSSHTYTSHVTNEWSQNKAHSSLIICNCHNYLHNYFLAMNQSWTMKGRLLKSLRCHFELTRGEYTYMIAVSVNCCLEKPEMKKWKNITKSFSDSNPSIERCANKEHRW